MKLSLMTHNASLVGEVGWISSGIQVVVRSFYSLHFPVWSRELLQYCSSFQSLHLIGLPRSCDLALAQEYSLGK